MRRRDVSSFFVGSVAGSMLVSKSANAQSCVPPCYVAIPSESGVTPLYTQYPPLDVRRYGATMDGVTSDTVALQHAISVATVANGGEIFIPAGTLRLTAAQVLPPRTSLKGVGRALSKIKVDGSFVGLSVSTANHDPIQSQVHTRIEGIGFLGVSGALGALHFSKVNYVLLRDCAFEDFVGTAFGVQMTQCYVWGVEHCIFQNIGGVGLKLVAADGVGCNQGVFGPNNEVIGNNQASFIGISVDRAQNVVITGNDFEGSTNGNKAIDLEGTDGVWIAGNYIELWTQAAIAANSGPANRRLFIMENVINATSPQVCNFNNVANPNSNVVVALNRFADLGASQTCVFVGSTTNFCEFNNDPDIGRITEGYSPSCAAARALEKNTAWNPAAIASGAVGAVSVNVPGAVVGDPCVASFDKVLTNNVLISAHVSAANTVRVVLFNKEGVSVDLPAGTVRVKVFK